MFQVREKVPYYLNEEVIKKMVLFPCESDEYQIDNKDPMLLNDFMRIVAKEIRKESTGPVEMTVVNDFIDLIVQVGSKYYGFKSHGDTYIIKEKEDEAKAYSHCTLELLRELLKLIKVSKDIGGTLWYTWYFFKDIVNPRLPGVHFRFFVCNGDQIIGETELVEGPGWKIPENLLLDKRDYEWFDRMDENALTVICYQKWEKENLSGKIYAVRKELEAPENDSVTHAGLQQLNDKTLEASEKYSTTDAAPPRLNDIEIITLLKKIKRDITYGILIICILLFFILIRIH